MDMAADRMRRVWGYLAIAVVGGTAITLAARLLGGPGGVLGLDHDGQVLTMALGAALALAWTMVFAALSFHSSDEFRQQGSMIAWYWGGSAGLAVSSPIYVFVMMGGLTMIGLAPRLAPTVAAVAARSFMMGYLLPVLLQVAGFFVVRTWWRASKR
jgi:hypothetical protein